MVAETNEGGTAMKLSLNKFQLVYYIQGSVRSAHGKDEIWHRVIKEFIPKLTNDEIDFLWWVCFRDFWHDYLTSCTGQPDWAAISYLQGLAALNRNNRYMVSASKDIDEKTCLCYKFQGKYHVVGDNYNRCVAEEYITHVELIKLHEGEPNMQDRFVKDWQDLALYEKTPEELLNTRKGLYQ